MNLRFEYQAPAIMQQGLSIHVAIETDRVTIETNNPAGFRTLDSYANRSVALEVLEQKGPVPEEIRQALQ
jgi:hypothetical protein